MERKALFKAVSARWPDLDEQGIYALLSHMDRAYLSCCVPSEVAEHLEISRSLQPDHPVHLRVTQEADRLYKMVIIAFDYFSEFSIVCGLLSAFGLNIEGGHVQTVSTGHGRKKIIDLFHVRTIGDSHFDPERQAIFKEELEVLIGLLEKGMFREARARVNKKLISHISQIQGHDTSAQHPLKGLLAPIQIHFDNSHSRQWTILSIHGQDTHAFLYAFSNALAMRNIYIHRIKIRHISNQIHDRIYISNRQGRKINRKNDKKALRIAVVLIKQFIHYLNHAPDPTMAITHFDQLLDKILAAGHTRTLIGFLKQKETMNLLARLFGTSQFLWEDFLRIRFETLFPLLEKSERKGLKTGKETIHRNLKKRLKTASGFQEKRKILNDFKDEEMFRIDLRHLREFRGDLRPFSAALSDLAEVVVSFALKVCDNHLKEKYGSPSQADQPSPFAIFGLGKLGGRELGYASDIELIFVYIKNGFTDGPHPIANRHYFEKLTQEITRFIETRQEGIFHIDTRLRPYGKSGQWAISLSQFESYYAATGKAADFERQALIKLRYIAGSRSLGKKCETARDRFVYSGAPWDLKAAGEVRKRQIDELVLKEKVNVKYSNGGIIDIEYFVQYLQIIHGEKIPALRTPNTLEGLAALSNTGIISKKTAETLKQTYLFLRSLIDALRMVRGNARDLLLPEQSSDEFAFLARRMGYAKKDWQQGKKQLETAISLHMSAAYQQYQNIVNLPPLQ